MESISVKMDFGHCYLVIENKVEFQNLYLLRMILDNKINGFLSCRESFEENVPYLYYEITSKKSLMKEYDLHNINFEEIFHIFFSLENIIKRANSYLLDSSYFVFDPQYMYFDLDTNELSILYIPYSMLKKDNILINSGFNRKYYLLADFLLEKTDHKDEHAVNIAYQFYKMSKEEYFSIETFINYIEKEKVMKETEAVKNSEVIKTEVNDINDTSSQTMKNQNKKTWVLPIFLGLLGLIVLIIYFSIKNLFIYSLYIFVFSIILIFVALVKVLEKVFNKINHYRELKYETIYEEVSVDDYWKESNETVFFDEDAVPNSSNYTLKWKENGFEKEYILSDFPVIIGKLSGEANCIIDNISISRIHAKFIKKDISIKLQDLSSTNGTFINGIRLNPGEEITIQRKDEIQFGKVTISVV